MVEGYWLIDVKVTPKAKENKLVSWDGVTLKIRVTETPEKGKANQAVIHLLSKFFDLPQREFTIVSGLSTKSKKILLPDSCKTQLENFF